MLFAFECLAVMISFAAGGGRDVMLGGFVEGGQQITLKGSAPFGSVRVPNYNDQAKKENKQYRVSHYGYRV